MSRLAGCGQASPRRIRPGRTGARERQRRGRCFADHVSRVSRVAQAALAAAFGSGYGAMASLSGKLLKAAGAMPSSQDDDAFDLFDRTSGPMAQASVPSLPTRLPQLPGGGRKRRMSLEGVPVTAAQFEHIVGYMVRAQWCGGLIRGPGEGGVVIGGLCVRTGAHVGNAVVRRAGWRETRCARCPDGALAWTLPRRALLALPVTQYDPVSELAKVSLGEAAAAAGPGAIAGGGAHSGIGRKSLLLKVSPSLGAPAATAP